MLCPLNLHLGIATDTLVGDLHQLHSIGCLAVRASYRSATLSLEIQLPFSISSIASSGSLISGIAQCSIILPVPVPVCSGHFLAIEDVFEVTIGLDRQPSTGLFGFGERVDGKAGLVRGIDVDDITGELGSAFLAAEENLEIVS